ncbi:chemotaxis protein CheW [Alkalihalobacterium chitinilyticum]|uniref:Chemotaxis protein CheA n=1 Tax=Alkalihalobacterium chitinilyticum TaxID=2980103 RepID=A0ABT5VJA1_9BACI|nr:chemotaxis protein CheW [Alkalihalobacterium chitinilyticum]MDE5415538.1 chemotaxis protein CheW [Alkalihalobacterium chitinilyticum]
MEGINISEYIGVFLDEVDEQLLILDQQIIELENDPANREIINNIFRAAHTLKGSSAAMGFEVMKELTHHLEGVFDLIRRQQLQSSKEIFDVMFQSIDVIKQIKSSIIEGRGEDIDISPLLKSIEATKAKKVTPEIKDSNEFDEMEAVLVVEEPLVIHFDQYQKHVLHAALNDQYLIFNIHIQLQKKSLMKSVRTILLHNNLKEVGEIAVTFPQREEIEAETFNGNFIFTLITMEEEGSIQRVIEQVSEIESVKICPVTIDQLVVENEMMTEGELAAIENTTSSQPLEILEVQQGEEIVKAEETLKQKLKINPTVRVDVDKLEHLMNLVGELVIDQTRLVEVRNRFSRVTVEHQEEVEILTEVTNHLNRVIGELQEGMMKTRMLPIEQLFNRFPRLVRDTASIVQKEVDFLMEGKETELDRTLIEEISDPLIHLLRNSVDHGIETPDERERVGKPRKGKVLVKAFHQENHIVITITDDGRGIDAQKIKETAIINGTLTEDEASKMTERDLIFLIFKSGLSTVKQVSDISGRGVGMDIVRSHIEKLNGIIDIETEVGKGTTFTIKLPLTLAIIRSLLIELGKRIFAIPLVNVLEIIRLNPEEVQTVKDKEVAIVRGSVLPLVRMDQKLGIRQEKTDNQLNETKRIFVIVVGIADKRIGIIADRTLGNQEIVIKSLGQYIGNPPHIAGATIMGNGNVALILDIASVVNEEGAQDNLADQKQNSSEENEEDQLVTFKLANEEYGINISYVKDIISIPKITKVVTSAPSVLGMINLRGKVIPVIDLRDYFNLPTNSFNKKTRVIVVKISEAEVGYLVDEVTQVLKVNRNCLELCDENNTYVNTEIIEGICHLGERLITVLDFEQLIYSQEIHQLTNEKLEEIAAQIN